jgi:hypothetical protein
MRLTRKNVAEAEEKPDGASWSRLSSPAAEGLAGKMSACGLARVGEQMGASRSLETSLRAALDPQDSGGYIAPPSRAGCLREIRKNAVGKPV